MADDRSEDREDTGARPAGSGGITSGNVNGDPAEARDLDELSRMAEGERFHDRGRGSSDRDYGEGVDGELAPGGEPGEQGEDSRR